MLDLHASPEHDGNAVDAGGQDGALGRADWDKSPRSIVLARKGAVKPETRRRNRKFVEAILWAGRHQGMWAMLPPHFGKHRAMYVKFTRWAQQGTWWPVVRALGSSTNAALLSRLVSDYETRAEKRRQLREFRRRMKAVETAALPDRRHVRPARPSHAHEGGSKAAKAAITATGTGVARGGA